MDLKGITFSNARRNQDQKGMIFMNFKDRSDSFTSAQLPTLDCDSTLIIYVLCLIASDEEARFLISSQSRFFANIPLVLHFLGQPLLNHTVLSAQNR